MSELLLTAYNGSILGPIAKGLGWIMDKIYNFFSFLGFGNIALTIFVFTIVVYLLMFPLTYKQQRFSVISRKMQPEMKAIQEKYKGKKDQTSMQKQQEETQALYDKYGISMVGSCGYMIIQMPILFALYRVFYNVPAYIHSVKDIFTDVVDGIIKADGVPKIQKIFEGLGTKTIQPDFTNKDINVVKDSIIDVLYKLPASGWNEIKTSFPDLASKIDDVIKSLKHINYLFNLNISDTPLNLIKTGWANNKNFALIIAALLIPLLSYASQLLNIKLNPTTNNGEQSDQMAQQMKTMNFVTPLFSLFIAFSVPVGLGLYWIAGAVVRSIQMVFLNKHFEKIDLEKIIEKNKDKAAAKAEKRGIRQAQIYEAARMSTKKSMLDKANLASDEELLNRASELRSNASKGSLAAKANLVKEFNEKNNK